MKQILTALFLLPFLAGAQTGDIVVPGANLVTDGIPAIPAEIRQNMQRYSEARSAGFVDWHPKDQSMLISTRFGNTAQLHLVKMPMGSRKQMTFFEDAVGNGSFEPISGRYFLFNKDAGGNEFSQIYRYDMQTGESVLLSDGGHS